jgi:hypothetical protein
MTRSVVAFAIGVIILGVAYYWLTFVTVGASVYFLAPGPWLKHSVGIRYGIPIWSLLLNTLAIALAAVPVAVLAKVAFGRRAVLVALAAAIGVSAYSLVEMLRGMHSAPTMPPLPWHLIAVISFDNIMLTLLPALVLWLAGRWLPKFRLSGP